MDEHILRAFAAEYKSKHLVPALGRGQVCAQLSKGLDVLAAAYVERYALQVPDATEREEGDIAVRQASFRIGRYDSENLKQRAVLLHLMGNLERYVPLGEVAKAVQSRTQPTAMVLRGLETQVTGHSTDFSLKASTNHAYRLSKATGRVVKEKYGVRVCERGYSILDYDCTDDKKRLVLLHLLNAEREIVRTSEIGRICGVPVQDVRGTIAEISDELSRHIKGWSIGTYPIGYRLRNGV